MAGTLDENEKCISFYFFVSNKQRPFLGIDTYVKKKNRLKRKSHVLMQGLLVVIGHHKSPVLKENAKEVNMYINK